MTLSREVIVDGTIAEFASFGELIRSIDINHMNRPTRCSGWTIGQLAAHVVGAAADIAAGRLDDLDGSERQQAERAGRTPVELADELANALEVAQVIASSLTDEEWDAPAPTAAEVAGTLGHAVEAIWFDVFIHSDDVRAALGRPSTRGQGMTAAVSHIADCLERDGWGPAVLELENLDTIVIGGDDGPRVNGDPMAFVLAATGRADPGDIGLGADVNIRSNGVE